MKTKSRREALKLLSAGAAALAAPALAEGAPPLRVRRINDFRSFDPPLISNVEDEAITASIMAPLLRNKPTGNGLAGGLEAHLVTSWGRGGDRKTYTFEIRDTENWKKLGGPIMSSDVAFSFGRLATSKTWGLTFSRTFDSVRVIDARRFEVRLRVDDPAFPTLFLPRGIASVTPNASVTPAFDFRLSPPDHSGSFMIRDLVPGRSLLLERNRAWAGDPPKLDQVEFIVIPDEKVAQGARDRKEIDVMLLDRQTLLMSGASAPSGWRSSQATTGRVPYLVLFPNSKSLQSLEARRGVQLAIDKADLARAVYSEYGARRTETFAVAGWLWPGPENALKGRRADAVSLLRGVGTATLQLGVLPLRPEDTAALMETAAFVAKSLKEFGVSVQFGPIDPQRFFSGEGPKILPELDMLLTSASVWDIGILGTLLRFASWHSIGSPAIEKQLGAAVEAPSRDALSSIEATLVDMGALLTLVEENAVWSHREEVSPVFGPHGGVVDLGAWAVG